MFLLAGTALLSTTSGYLLMANKLQQSESNRGMEEACVLGHDKPHYGTTNDFCKSIDELKATFPEPGTVLGDPEDLGPFGFSKNDYHPGIPCFLANIDHAENLGV